LIQRRGGPVETVRTGDNVRVTPGGWHWHGATATAFMTHLAIEEIPIDGAEPDFDRPVTDAEYYGDQQIAPATDTPPVARTVVLDQLMAVPSITHRVEIHRISIAAASQLACTSTTAPCSAASSPVPQYIRSTASRSPY
jgi:hypothetical protein